MATTAQNAVSVVEPNRYPQWVTVTSDQAINEGDLVYWDGTNYTAKALSASSQVQSNFLGVALGSTPGTIYPGDDAIVGIPVLAKACVYVNTTNAESYTPYQAVTIGADAQTVTNQSVTANNRVGFVIINPPDAPRPNQATPVPESVTGAAGVRIRIQLEPKHVVGAAL